MKKLFLFFFLSIFIISCENTMTRQYGGTQKIELESGERLVNITWKGDNLWILTKLDATSKPTVHVFKESSKFGVLEGEISIYEK